MSILVWNRLLPFWLIGNKSTNLSVLLPMIPFKSETKNNLILTIRLKFAIIMLKWGFANMEIDANSSIKLLRSIKLQHVKPEVTALNLKLNQQLHDYQRINSSLIRNAKIKNKKSILSNSNCSQSSEWIVFKCKKLFKLVFH